MRARALAFALAPTLAACAHVPSPKTQAGAPTIAPDRQYMLEMGENKQRVLVWDCVDNHRVVMTNSCDKITCEGEWAVHKSMCGGGDGWWDQPASQRKPMPPGTGW